MARRYELFSTDRFTIESSEGLPIRGIIQAPENPGVLVVLVHGFKGFMQWGFFPWLAEYLVSRGVAVCRFDFSRNGVGASGHEFDELELFRDDTYGIELDDLSSVVTYLGTRPTMADLPISLLGHSRGGAVALLGAEAVPSLSSVVTWSAISSLSRWDEATLADWRRRGSMEIMNSRTGQVMTVSTAILDDLERQSERLDVGAAVRTLKAPLLIVHGGGDDTVSVREAHVLAEAAPESSTLVIDGASHTFGAIHPLVHVPFDLTLAATVSASFIRAC